MTNHTPGPWVALGCTVYHFHPAEPGEVLVPYDHRDWVATCSLAVEQDRMPTESEQANARLIAAAPELLEALKLAFPCVEYAEYMGFKAGRLPKLQKQIRAAIAKAEGRSE